MNNRILKLLDKYFFAAVTMNGVVLAILFNFWMGLTQIISGIIGMWLAWKIGLAEKRLKSENDALRQDIKILEDELGEERHDNSQFGVGA